MKVSEGYDFYDRAGVVYYMKTPKALTQARREQISTYLLSPSLIMYDLRPSIMNKLQVVQSGLINLVYDTPRK